MCGVAHGTPAFFAASENERVIFSIGLLSQLAGSDLPVEKNIAGYFTVNKGAPDFIVSDLGSVVVPVITVL